MLSPISTVRAELINRDYKTEGSNPLEVLADDGEIYIAKTTVGKVPWNEVINEILCGYLARCWGLEVPDCALVSISQKLADSYQSRYGLLSSRHYVDCQFDKRHFFGSKRVTCQTEVEQYLVGPTHYAQMSYFRKPLDWIKIGVFDTWVGNRDRKPDNPNILLRINEDSSFDLVPIDHTAAFAYYEDYQQVNDSRLFIEPKRCILAHRFTQSVVKFTDPNDVQSLKADVLAGIGNALSHLDFIFEQVPAEWGFSRKSRAHLKQFLSDPTRNERIASEYLFQLK